MPTPPDSNRLAPSTAPAATAPRVNLVASIKSQVRRDQVVCVAIAILLLVAILFLQPTLNRQRSKLVQTSNKSLGNLLITFPRLTLGGFRGILAMALWENAESDKNKRQWVPLESDYNAIAALEPYFGAVYIFNAWNQAYNLSAQFHAMNLKYKWVLDGQVYLYKGQKLVPNDSNMIMNEANNFFLKLGTSFERKYYCARWRYDIAHLYRYVPGKVQPTLSTLAEVHYIVMQPEFHCVLLPARDRKGPLGHGVKVGHVHYRYGLSPFYFAWVEYRRALRQPELPTDSGEAVLYSWPPMALRLWCRDDLYYAQRLTWHIFSAASGHFTHRFAARVANIRDCYRNVQMNAPRSIREFRIYFHMFPSSTILHMDHLVEVQYYQKLGLAENMLFNALVQWQLAGRRFRLGDAADHDFAAAIPLFEQARAAYKHYLNIAYPPSAYGQNPEQHSEMKYLSSLSAVIAGIENFRRTASAGHPSLSFLNVITLTDSD
jgi:hypothetical protein